MLSCFGDRQLKAIDKRAALVFVGDHGSSHPVESAAGDCIFLSSLLFGSSPIRNDDADDFARHLSGDVKGGYHAAVHFGADWSRALFAGELDAARRFLPFWLPRRRIQYSVFHRICRSALFSDTGGDFFHAHLLLRFCCCLQIQSKTPSGLAKAGFHQLGVLLFSVPCLLKMACVARCLVLGTTFFAAPLYFWLSLFCSCSCGSGQWVSAGKHAFYCYWRLFPL